MRYLSVFERDSNILTAIDDIFLKNDWFDLDCTYSKGVFYSDIKPPRLKSDLEPLFEDVIKSDCTKLDFREDKFHEYHRKALKKIIGLILLKIWVLNFLKGNTKKKNIKKKKKSIRIGIWMI